MRSERAWFYRLIALVSVLALLAAACGGDDDDDDGTGTETDGDAADVPEGGELLIGAEQEPDCTAWTKSCAGSSWGTWMMGVNTLPRAWNTTLNDDGEWEHTYNEDLLTEEPTIDTSNPDTPVITYRIRDEAVWSDETPITCADFEFTALEVRDGEDVYDPTGYTAIDSFDCSDPKTVVINMAEPYSGWKAFFGALYGVLPAHLLEGKDLLAEMGDGYDWSGGPWIFEWTKTVEIVLTPNPNWYGPKPKLERVVFRVQADTAAQFRTFQNGEVAMIYPQPQPDVVAEIEAGIDANNEYSPMTGNLEALWMNNGTPPLDDLNVRKAIGYALDREALVQELFGPLGVEEPMQTLSPPILAPFADTEAWADYTPDPDQVDALMTESGWAKNADGIWEKDGEPATLSLKTTAGNQRRELTGQIIERQLGDAGFIVEFETLPAGDLFGQDLPAGNYDMGIYAQVLTAITVGQCNLFCSKNIPSEENQNSGQNWTRTNIPEIDPILEELDQTSDEDRQAELGKQADALLSENMASLPLDPLPNILLWNDSVVGDVGDNPVLGPFWNLHMLGVNA